MRITDAGIRARRVIRRRYARRNRSATKAALMRTPSMTSSAVCDAAGALAATAAHVPT